MVAREDWTEAADQHRGVDVICVDFLLSWLGQSLDPNAQTCAIRNRAPTRHSAPFLSRQHGDCIFQTHCLVPCGSRTEFPKGVTGSRLFSLLIDDSPNCIKQTKILLINCSCKNSLDAAHERSVANQLPLNVGNCGVQSLRSSSFFQCSPGTHMLSWATLKKDLRSFQVNNLSCYSWYPHARETAIAILGLLSWVFGKLQED